MKHNLTGMHFGHLFVVGRSEKMSKAGTLWDCLCACGNTSTVDSLKLRSAKIVSCGCFRREALAYGYFRRTHGQANNSPTYKTWKEMRQRCLNPNNDKWKWYGGRGITVCERWNSFENFLEDMGKRPDGMTLDRIDNNLGYSKENCTWATHIDQTQKQEKNKLRNGVHGIVRADRESGMTYDAIAKKHGISKTTAHRCCAGLTWKPRP